MAHSVPNSIVPGDCLNPWKLPRVQRGLFDRFTQQDGTASRVQQGTGLGLAISKGIVEAHGGSIHLDTATDRGATFRVDLPLGE